MMAVSCGRTRWSWVLKGFPNVPVKSSEERNSQ